MKAISFASVAAALVFSATLQAAPRVVCSTPSLQPESEVDVVFDRPVVDRATLGKPVDFTHFTIDPPIPGRVIWTAPEIARLVPDAPPVLGTTYRFSIPYGETHLDGSHIRDGRFGTLTVEGFNVSHASIRNRWSGNYERASTEFLVIFNDDVDVETSAPSFAFRSAEGREVAARVTRATARDAGHLARAFRRWADRAVPAAEAPALEDDMDLPHALIVAPEQLLPVGKRWSLVVRNELPNLAGDVELTHVRTFSIGDIEPFKIERVSAEVSPDAPRGINLVFNHNLPAELPDDLLTRIISVDPLPENLTATPMGRVLKLSGDFTVADNYRVRVDGPFQSASGHPLEEWKAEDVKFERCSPVVMLPSGDEAQYAAGSRRYEVHTVNISHLHVRVKSLTEANLVRASQGYRHYSGQGPDYSSISPTAPLPFGLIVGDTVADLQIPLDNPVDTSRTVTLNWDDILPAGHKRAALFLDVIGTPRVDSGVKQRINTQALVQLTDIGLAWKLNDREALVHAFSCETGAPLADVQLTLFGEDATAVGSATTDADGLARLPRGGDARHLHATLGRDNFVTSWDRRMASVGMWHFPVRVSWRPAPEEARRVFLFSDRPLYRPGETLRLKGVMRMQRGNTIDAHTPAAARIVIADPTGRELHTEPVTFSAMGSFDVEYTLPDGRTGHHTAKLEFTDELAAAADIQDWWERESATNQSVFTHGFRVDEFRRNAFEVAADTRAPENGASLLTIDLKASYYQGTPVAVGGVQGHTRISATNLYPERFRDYLFGDHRRDDWYYWYRYFGFRDGDASRGDIEHNTLETRLTPEGTATVTIDLPESATPRAREVSFSTTITDANNQSVTATTSTIVHPADIYLGVSRVDRLIRAGRPLELRLVAATPAGEPFDGDVEVTANLTREVNFTTNVANARGQVVSRNEKSEEDLTSREILVRAAESSGTGHRFELTPQSSGLHFLTLTGRDAAGRAFSTTTRFHVYGEKEFPWAYEEGMRIKLVAEKKQYQPGETARILVLSPIEGTALVTTERENVIKTFRTEITLENPVIEIPLDHDDAPNVYASVLIMRGSADSQREHPEPQLRLGYCEIMVENSRDRLVVEIDHDSAISHRPGDSVELGGTVTLADGSPAANAEVTLFAVDEGTLAVTGFETPDPMAHFYDPRLLRIQAGTSFQSFLSEIPGRRYFHNKGFFIGGGGDDFEEWIANTRSNFDPCATWAPALTTDGSGRFNHAFVLPDTLTRYRIIAVAHHDAARFGHGVSSLVASKDLMIEPMAPRFANQGDAITPQILVQNASTHTATWEITARADTGDGGEPQPVRFIGDTTRTLTLAPGASATLDFPLAAEDTGEARIVWSARPLAIDGGDLTPTLARALSDSVESVFPVHFPMPMLRQHHIVRLDAGASTDLRTLLDETLSGATGSLEIDAAVSPLLQAADSIEYLLHYPHGCLEQTTSGMIPWIAARNLRTFVPAFAKYDDATIRHTIQGAVDRILVMLQPDGSFSYWPGQSDSVDWATPYAALGLALAERSGATIPASAKDSLGAYLIGSLRGLGDATGAETLATHARTLLALSIAGHPQPAYENRLLDRADAMHPAGRAMLATAIALRAHADGGDPAALASARTLITTRGTPSDNEHAWMPWAPDLPLDLLAWTAIAPDSAETHLALDRLLHERNPFGHWRTTWVNGWALIAISEYARHHADTEISTHLAITGSVGDETLVLNRDNLSVTRGFRLTPETSLTLTAGPAPVHLRVNAAAKPAITPVSPVSKNGMSIERTYERILPDGSSEILDEPAVGDLVRVSLQVTLPADYTRYLVVEDLLPAIFEPVHGDFAGQRAITGGRTSESDWRVSHYELRADRACFYLDFIPRRGTHTLTYLVRCTLPGQTIAPPAKVESMYDPENHALSASRPFTTR